MRVPALEGIGLFYVCGGANHTLALTSSGRVLAWGRNDDFQLGLGHDQDCWIPQDLGIQNASSISAGAHSSYVITNELEAYSWGMGECFMMCNGVESSMSTPSLMPICSTRKFVQAAAGS